MRGQVTVEGVRENVNVEWVEDQDLPSGFMSVHVPLRSGKCSIIGRISRLVIFVSSALFPFPLLYIMIMFEGKNSRWCVAFCPLLGLFMATPVGIIDKYPRDHVLANVFLLGFSVVVH